MTHRLPDILHMHAYARSNHYALTEIALKGLSETLQGLREEVWEDQVPERWNESKS